MPKGPDELELAGPASGLTSVEERDYGENAAVIVLGRRQPQLGEDAVNVLFDRSLGDPELTRNAGVRAALGHQREHLALAPRQDVERVFDTAGGDELLDEHGIDHGSPRTIHSSVSTNAPTSVTRLFSR